MKELLLQLIKKGISLKVSKEELIINAPKNVLDQETIQILKRHKQDLIEYLTRIESEKRPVNNEVEPAQNAETYLLSSGQMRLWLLSHITMASVTYNIPSAYEFKGDLNIAALEDAFRNIINRHEILRTVFVESLDGIRQKILPKEQSFLHIKTHDLTQKDGTQKVNEIINNEIDERFDLTTGPLIRACLLKMDNDRFIFIYTLHHIISDGWSMNILLDELMYFYNNFNKKEIIPLEQLPIHYKDYAVWQQKKLESNGFEKARQYWLDRFREECPIIDIPTDFKRPKARSFNGDVIEIKINKQASTKLQSLCSTCESTLFMGLLGSVYALLYKYTNQKKIVIGSPVAGREQVNLENQIGFYVNTLPLKIEIDPEKGFIHLLKEIREVVLSAHKHQSYPFDKLLGDLQWQLDTSRSPMFDIMVVLVNTHMTEQILPGIKVESYPLKEQRSKCDLTFAFVEAGDEIILKLNYSTDLFEKNRMDQFKSHYLELIKSITANVQQPLKDLEYLNKEEQEELLYIFNNTVSAYSSEETIQGLFEQQAVQHPEAIAFQYEGKVLTYRELNEQSNQLAHYLRAQFDIKPDDLIGLMLDRTEYLLIAILGILKSGAAYVPIDPDLPEERIDYMLEDSAVKTLITKAAIATEKSLRIANLLEIDARWADIIIHSMDVLTPISTPDHLAYVIYTSGSTGRPKGVMIENKSLVNLSHWHKTNFSLTPSSKATLYAGQSFDAAVWEIWPYLISGSSLYPVPENCRLDLDLLITYLNKNNITHSFFPTAICEQLIKYEDEIAGQLTILTGGDQLKQFSKKLNIHNNYGPTENTVVATSIKLDNDDQDEIPIGRPIDNVKTYIVDEYMNLQAKGIVGELCLSGTSLARGYLNDPESTKRAFVTSPFVAGERLYKTGDLVKIREDGNIIFVGRKDHQVKVRGYRIELGEIEQRLLAHDKINTVAVVSQQDTEGTTHLWAYYTSTSPLTARELKVYLRTDLPSYMIPSDFIVLEDLPLTSNGKIDHKVLAQLKRDIKSDKEYVLPSNVTEQKLVDIWCELLMRETVSVYDDFYEIGGNSISLVKMHTMIKRSFDTQISVADLFVYNSIRSLSDFLHEAEEKSLFGIDV